MFSSEKFLVLIVVGLVFFFGGIAMMNNRDSILGHIELVITWSIKVAEF